MGLDPIQKHIQDLRRLRLEEQQREVYRRKSDDNLNPNVPGDYYKPAPEKIAQPPIQGAGIPYGQLATGGVYPTTSTVTNEHQQQQQVYMIPAPAGAYHPQMVRPINAPPPQTQAYYTYQRLPPELYREHQQQQQQQQMYNFATPQSMAAPPQAASVPTAQGYGMIRQPVTGGGMLNEAAGYGQVAYDSAVGRQVIYSAPPGGVIGAPVQSAMAAQYQAVPVSGEIRNAVGLPQDVKGVAAAAAAATTTKVTTQASV